MAPRDDALAFGAELAAIFAGEVAGDFVGAWFVGSLALGGYVAGQSDLDVAAVCLRPLADETKRALAERLLASTARPLRREERTSSST